MDICFIPNSNHSSWVVYLEGGLGSSVCDHSLYCVNICLQSEDEKRVRKNLKKIVKEKFLGLNLFMMVDRYETVSSQLPLDVATFLDQEEVRQRKRDDQYIVKGAEMYVQPELRNEEISNLGERFIVLINFIKRKRKRKMIIIFFLLLYLNHHPFIFLSLKLSN